jgi:transcriptional regulator with XRE-family HTH domain
MSIYYYYLITKSTLFVNLFTSNDNFLFMPVRVYSSKGGASMNRFRELRQKKHLTQAELIQQYNERYGRNYSIPALSQMENGKRTPEMPALIDFADFFGVTVDYLLGRAGTASEMWTMVRLNTPFSGEYLSAQLGIPLSQVTYLEHGMDDKITPDTYDKLVGLYETLNSQVKVGWNKPLEKSFDIMKEIQQSTILECDGKKYRIDDNLRDKLYTAIKLALM